MSGIHEMSANNREYNAKSVLGWKFHTLLILITLVKLMPKYLSVEAEMSPEFFSPENCLLRI